MLMDLLKITHDQVYFIVLESKWSAVPFPLFTQHSERMSIIYHDLSMIWLLARIDFRKVTDITFHAKNTIDDNHLYSIHRYCVGFTLEIGHIIMTKL